LYKVAGGRKKSGQIYTSLVCNTGGYVKEIRFIVDGIVTSILSGTLTE
jgi:hypothetical protein